MQILQCGNEKVRLHAMSNLTHSNLLQNNAVKQDEILHLTVIFIHRFVATGTLPFNTFRIKLRLCHYTSHSMLRTLFLSDRNIASIPTSSPSVV
jgi:hypothetical protein